MVALQMQALISVEETLGHATHFLACRLQWAGPGRMQRNQEPEGARDGTPDLHQLSLRLNYWNWSHGARTASTQGYPSEEHNSTGHP
jgi:hypothetical protein